MPFRGFIRWDGSTDHGTMCDATSNRRTGMLQIAHCSLYPERMSERDFFRSLILSVYNEQCAICNMPVRRLLVASHIVPWSVDPSQRMNPRNGICLCSLHDRAFD